MEALSVAASITAVVQLAAACLKVGRRLFGSSEHNSARLLTIVQSLYSFNGTIRNLQTHYEINEDDQARLDTLSHLAEPLKRCEEALAVISKRLETVNFLGQYIIGNLFDKKLEKSLRELEEARKLFKLALLSDNQIIISAVERYVRNIAEDVRDVQITLNKNSKRLLSLDCLSREHYEHAKRWRADTGAEIRATQDVALSIRDHIRTSKTDQERQAIIDWLSPLDFSMKQNDIFSRRQEGTGQWLLESRNFQSWLSTPGSTLWCPGIPGAGKTTLVSIAVDYLLKKFKHRDDVSTACIYCNYNEHEIQSPVNLIASLWRQLVQPRVSLSIEVQDLYQSHIIAPSPRPTLSEVSKLLQSEMKVFSRIFIIIDALDECPEDNQFRAILVSELRALQPRINLLVTSRFLDTISCEFAEAKTVQINATIEDLKMYIQGRISRETRLSEYVQRDPALGEEIIETIAENAQQMFVTSFYTTVRQPCLQCYILIIFIRFLLARLHMDSMTTKGTSKAVREALRVLPRELDDTYEEAMKRIGSQNKDDKLLAEQVLSWISFAARPLTLEELQCALAVKRYQPELDKDNLIEKKFLISVCAGLVTVDLKGIISFVHPTTKEYFERIRVNRFSTAQKEIAETCLTYLLFDEFANGPCLTDIEIDRRIERNPLLIYAARHWGDHARGEPELILRDFIFGFLGREANVSSAMQAMIIPQRRPRGYSQVFPRNISPLTVAALFGMSEIVKLLLSNAADIEAEDSDGRTALHWAAERGHEVVAHMLLENGADIEGSHNLGWTPLQMASENGHLSIVQLFMQWNVNINARDDEEVHPTALQLASGKGYLEIVRALLDQNADANAEPALYGGRTALQAASENGHFSVVSFLLERGADVNAKPAEIDGKPALQAASGGGYLKIVQLFLEHGADINAKYAGVYGGTALQAASGGGYFNIVQQLLEAGADVNAKPAGDYGRTALQAASGKGDANIVQLLLDEGADINAEPAEHTGRTALQAATKNNDIEIVCSLLKQGADVNARPCRIGGRTALQAASGAGHLEIVHLLLVNGAEVNAKPSEIGGRTALQAAAESGHLDVTQLLLDWGADINAKPVKTFGRTALQGAAGNGHVRVICCLLEQGADVNDNPSEIWGRTALQAASGAGHLKAVQLLLGHGAEIDSKAVTGRTALQAASEEGRLNIVQQLLGQGANIHGTDKNRRTALHKAAWRGHSEVVKMLLENGATIETQDGCGETALCLAAGGGQLAVVRLLIENGANVAVVSDSGSSALHSAAKYEHLEVVRLLAETGAKVNAMDKYGWTALHHAAEGGYSAIVRLLIEKGANIETKSESGDTALHRAASGGYRGVVRMLLQAGASTNEKNNKGYTALYYAVKHGCLAVARLLLKKPEPKDI